MNAEAWIALAAAMIALIAMATAIWQLIIQRNHNKLSVRPFLDAQFEAKDHVPYTIKLSNCGLGPAVVTNFEIHIGQSVLSFPKIHEISHALKTIGINIPGGAGYIAKNSIIKSGDSITLLDFNKDEVYQIHSQLEHIKFVISYKCAYGDVFKLDIPLFAKA